MLFKIENRPAEAVAPLQRFLVLAPQDHPLRKQVLGVLADAKRAAQSKP